MSGRQLLARCAVAMLTFATVSGSTACAGTAKPTRAAFEDHSLVIVSNAKTAADKARTRTVFGCLYGRLDDQTIEDLMDVGAGDKISDATKQAITAPLGECYKQIAGTPTTTVPTTTVPTTTGP